MCATDDEGGETKIKHLLQWKALNVKNHAGNSGNLNVNVFIVNYKMTGLFLLPKPVHLDNSILC